MAGPVELGGIAVSRRCVSRYLYIEWVSFTASAARAFVMGEIAKVAAFVQRPAYS
jgi:hypothetical protein